jgi:PHD finger-like domain-containing protein 5A
MCRKQPGIAIGRVCDKCDGKCPVCDSYVRPTTLVRICDECSFGNYQNKCVVCGGEGISDAFYCFECTRLEKDRDGCPKIINLGSSRTDVRFPPWTFELLFSQMLTIFLRNLVILPEKNESGGKLLTSVLPGSGHLGFCLYAELEFFLSAFFFGFVLLGMDFGLHGLCA